MSVVGAKVCLFYDTHVRHEKIKSLYMHISCHMHAVIVRPVSDLSMQDQSSGDARQDPSMSDFHKLRGQGQVQGSGVKPAPQD